MIRLAEHIQISLDGKGSTDSYYLYPNCCRIRTKLRIYTEEDVSVASILLYVCIVEMFQWYAW